MKWVNVIGIFVAAGTLALAGCGSKDYPRGQFQGYVIGKTEAEIIEKVGEPAKIDRSNPDKPVMIFQSKTFDPDNMNQADPVTRVFLEKNKDGKVVATDVVFG